MASAQNVLNTDCLINLSDMGFGPEFQGILNSIVRFLQQLLSGVGLDNLIC